MQSSSGCQPVVQKIGDRWSREGNHHIAGFPLKSSSQTVGILKMIPGLHRQTYRIVISHLSTPSVSLMQVAQVPHFEKRYSRSLLLKLQCAYECLRGLAKMLILIQKV